MANSSEYLLVRDILADTNANVRPVINPTEAVNITLDITFHGVIEMVRDISFCLSIGSVYIRVVLLCTVINQLSS